MDIADYDNLLERIAFYITGITLDKMTEAEVNISILLAEAGYIETVKNEYEEIHFRYCNPRKPFQSLPAKL